MKAQGIVLMAQSITTYNIKSPPRSGKPVRRDLAFNADAKLGQEENQGMFSLSPFRAQHLMGALLCFAVLGVCLFL